MAIASMIIQAAGERTNTVIAALEDICGITVHSVTAKEEIIIVVETDSLAEVTQIARQVEQLSHVLGVFPAYISTADEPLS